MKRYRFLYYCDGKWHQYSKLLNLNRARWLRRYMMLDKGFLADEIQINEEKSNVQNQPSL